MSNQNNSVKRPTWVIAALVTGMLLTGTLNTLTTKIQFTMESTGADGETETFRKPWYSTFNMLFAMFLVGLVDKVIRMMMLAAAGPAHESLLDESDKAAIADDDKPPVPYKKKVMLVSIPAVFDLLATALSNTGILFIPASVFQMLRGSAIGFCALFSVIFLKRKMYAFNWIGLTLVLLGVFLVGLANMLGAAETGAEAPGASDAFWTMVGMSLVLSGQVVQAGQLIAEEWLMKDVDLPPMQIIGWEGAWGSLIMIVVAYPLLWVIPGADHGHLEDPVDTFWQMYHSGAIQAMVVVYIFSCATFNATGIAVTQALSAVHRMMLDATRTTLIWAFDLMVHYWFDPRSPFGEVWNSYSPLQLFGFAILVIGQAVYGEVLRLPPRFYPASSANPVMSAMKSPGSAIKVAGSPLPPERKTK